MTGPLATRSGALPRKPQRRIPHADQVRRRRELDEIRLQRPLTSAERIDDDDLAHRLYQRHWRQQLREAERALGGRR